MTAQTPETSVDVTIAVASPTQVRDLVNAHVIVRHAAEGMGGKLVSVEGENGWQERRLHVEFPTREMTSQFKGWFNNHSVAGKCPKVSLGLQ